MGVAGFWIGLGIFAGLFAGLNQLGYGIESAGRMISESLKEKSKNVNINL